jgi:hypothetical protein
VIACSDGAESRATSPGAAHSLVGHTAETTATISDDTGRGRSRPFEQLAQIPEEQIWLQKQPTEECRLC